MSSFKTPKGNELPLLNLRDKDYLEVKYRLVWFREEHPDWGVETEIVVAQKDCATAKATIKDSAGRIIATAHKSEDKQGFPDFMEKAETGAIGRALALIGYGTQFAQELEEGDRIVDAPVERKTPKPTQGAATEPVGPKPQEPKPVAPKAPGVVIGAKPMVTNRTAVIEALLANKSVSNQWNKMGVKQYLIGRFRKDLLVDLGDPEFEILVGVIKTQYQTAALEALNRPTQDDFSSFGPSIIKAFPTEDDLP